MQQKKVSLVTTITQSVIHVHGKLEDSSISVSITGWYSTLAHGGDGAHGDGDRDHGDGGAHGDGGLEAEHGGDGAHGDGDRGDGDHDHE